VANFNNNRQGYSNPNQPGMAQPGYTAPTQNYGGQIQQTGAIAPPALPQPQSGSGVRQIPMRTMRTSPVPTTPQSSVPQNASGFSSVVYNPQLQTQPNQAVVDPAKQILTMHTEAELARRQGRAYPPPPPIPQ
jgi:hypothetical protein